MTVLDYEGLSHYHEKAKKAFASTDSVEEINDYTTGINLVRGTRDFVLGTKKFRTTDRYADGFTTNNSSIFSTSVDEQGFTILNGYKAGATSSLAYSYQASPIQGVSEGDEFTVSFEFMVDDVAAWDVKSIFSYLFIKQDNTRSNFLDVYLSHLKDQVINSGVWKKINYKIKAGPESNYLIVQLNLYKNGSVHFRKLKVERGSINNPIWSPSPFDIDYINDETTGINLIRKSLDFSEGTDYAFPSTGTLYKDGFFATRWRYITVEKDNDGFYVADIDSTVPTDVGIYSNIINLNNIDDDYITVFFEFNPVSLLENAIILRFIEYTNSGNQLYAKNVTLSDIKINYETIDSNKWYKCEFQYKKNNAAAEFLTVAPYLVQPNECRYRKICAYKGRINHPIWSPSPFDYPTTSEVKGMLADAGSTDMSEYAKKTELAEVKADVASINDYTTGINLLRGTRDFHIGKKKMPNDSVRYEDGFYNTRFSFSTDRDGFTVAHYEHAGTNWINLYSSGFFIESGDKITCSVEFMVDDIAEATYSNGKIAMAALEYYEDGKRLTYTDWFVDPSPLKSGEWAKIVRTFTIPSVTNNGSLYAVIRFQLATGGSVYFKKAKAEFGEINNPVWSASPFDMDYINDETTGINLMKGTRDFILGSAYSGNTVVSENGFKEYKAGNGVIEYVKDEDGFTDAICSRGTGAATIYGSIYKNVKVGETYTFSFEYMFPEEGMVPANDSGIANVAFYNGTSGLNNKSVSFHILGNHEIGTWYKAKIVCTIPEDLNPETGYLLPTLVATNNTKVAYRKCVVYKGSINNPIWSASPFDVAQADEVMPADYPVVSLGTVTQIPSNSDLNTYIDPDTYACVLNNVASTLKNSPTTQAFKLYVSDSTGGNSQYRHQKIVTHGDDASTYIRSTINLGASWTAWRQTYANTTVRPIEGGGTGGKNVVEARANLSVLGSKRVEKYYGMTLPDGDDESWIRTTKNGLIPNSSNSDTEGSSLGTHGWPFKDIYSKTIYGSLRGKEGDPSTIYYTENVLGFVQSSSLLCKYLDSKKGPIRIRLPHKTDKNNMIRMKISVFDYVTSGACDYYINGYVYTTSKNWYAPNTGAFSVSNNDYRNRNTSIRFGATSDEYPVIEIGNIDTAWGYCRVVISDIISSIWEVGSLASEWKIELGNDTSFQIDTLAKTVNNPYLLSNDKLIENITSKVTTSDIDKMFEGTYTPSSTAKLVDDTAVQYAIDKIKEL